MEYQFYLNELAIDEPIGFADFELSMRRDDKTHGMQFEASTGALKFWGTAANYLIDQKKLYGIKANVVFTAHEYCNDPYQPIEEITGRLNFGKFRKICGDQCTVEIPLEEDGCKVIFKNKYDQKVDLDNSIAQDGLTPLPQYAALGIDIDLPAKALDVRAEGYVAATGDADGITNTPLESGYVHIRPRYQDERFNSIQTGQLANPVSSFSINQAFGGLPPSPQILFEDNVACFSGPAAYEVRLKGSFTLNGDNDFLWAKLRWLEYNFPEDEGPGSLGPEATVIQEFDILPPTGPGGYPRPNTQSYDRTFTGIVNLKYGYGYYAVLELAVLPGIFTISNTFDAETYFLVSIKKECPTTTTDAYLIHETLSRIAESITNGCVRVKSAYYGRTDSQPFAFAEDGCGALRMLTSGLKIRNAPDGKFFASIKDVFEGLNPIDNIGFDITTDSDDANRYIMRIESVDFFYQDNEVFVIDHIPEVTSEVQEQMHYARILVGYKKWEVEGVNGLDEFNSNREYRTSLDVVSSTLDITSIFIAGSYPIEITRQQSFAESGAADTKFDNEIFIITLLRQAYDFVVEQGGVSDAENIFDPPTIYNARISPVRNLMRWYKTIAAGYANLGDSANKLWFSAGTGNYNAIMELIAGAYDALCKMESMPISERQDVFITHFARPADYTPLWQNETAAFEYPLNVAEYKALTTNPYGYISIRCGSSGAYEKAYIKEVKFKPAKGIGNFVLIKKWEES